MTEQPDLQARLTRLAEHTAPPPREDLARTVATRHRARRRQTIGLTAVAAAVAGVVLAGATLLHPGPAAVPVAAPAAVADVLAGPTRGSLAGDAAFVEGVRALPWVDADTPAGVGDPSFPGIPDAPPATRSVVFAGEVAGRRLALVVGANTAVPQAPYDDPDRQTDLGALSPLAAAWFVGPPGAAPGDLELQSVPRGVDRTRPLAVFDDTSGALVVLVAPGDAVEVSLRPDIDAAGRVTRAWQPVDAAGGAAVLAVPPDAGATSRSLHFRVLREDVLVLHWGPDGVGDGDGPPAVELVEPRERPVPSPADAVVELGARDLLDTAGRTADDVSPTLLWSGDVPAPAGTPARAALVAATLPSGAVYATTTYALAMPDGSAGGTTCGSQLRPAGTPVTELTFVFRCDGTDATGASEVLSSVVVVGPASATQVRLVDGHDAEIARYPLVDGVAVVPAPADLASVETLAADGTGVAWTTPMGAADLGDSAFGSTELDD